MSGSFIKDEYRAYTDGQTAVKSAPRNAKLRSTSTNYSHFVYEMDLFICVSFCAKFLKGT